MIWRFLVLSVLMKLRLCQYSVGPQVYHDYHPESIHISGHMEPVRIVPIEAGSYQGHVPYHVMNRAPVLNVEHASVVIHPIHDPPVVGNYHVEEPIGPVYQDPVALHDLVPVLEEVDAQSTKRQGHNVALNMVPIEPGVPMLSLSMKEPVKKWPIRKQQNHKETQSKRKSRFFRGNFHINVDIKDLEFNKQQNTYSSVDANSHNYITKKPNGIPELVKTVLPNLPKNEGNFDINLNIEDVKFNQQTNTYSGVYVNSPNKLPKIRRRTKSDLYTALPKSTKIRRKMKHNKSRKPVFPKSSKHRQRIPSDLSGISDVPHVWINPV